MDRRAILALALALAGCTPPPRPDSSEPVEPSVAPEVEVAYLSGRWDRVIAELEPYRDRPPMPENAIPLEWLGRAYLATDRPAEAADTFERALACGPDPETEASIREALTQALEEPAGVGPAGDAHRLFLEGTAAARAGRWDQARDAFERLEALDPDGPRGLQARARLPLVRLRRFTVQLGLFRSGAEADRLAERLRGEGLEIDRLTAGEGERTIHLVVHGRFASYEEAEAAAGERRRAGGGDAIAVP